jgi:hypothetical protein
VAQAKSDIELMIETNMGNTPAQLQVLAAAIGRIDKNVVKTAQSHNMLGTSMNKLWRSALYGVSSYLSVSAVTGIAQGFMRASEEMASARIEFEKMITELVSLGDNINRIPDIKNMVLGWAAAFGMTNEQATQFGFTIGSLPSTLSEAQKGAVEQRSLMMSQMVGADTAEMNAKSIAKYIQNYPSVDPYTASLRIAKTAELGDFSMKELATSIPDLLAAGRALGASDIEMQAMTVSGAALAGDFARFTTGLRSGLSKLKDPETRKTLGIKDGASIYESFEKVAEAQAKNPDAMNEIFDNEQLTAMSQVLQSRAYGNQMFQELAAVGPGSPDIIAQKVNQRYRTDPSFYNAQVQSFAQKVVENIEQYPDANQPQFGAKTSGDLAEMLYRDRHRGLWGKMTGWAVNWANRISSGMPVVVPTPYIPGGGVSIAGPEQIRLGAEATLIRNQQELDRIKDFIPEGEASAPLREAIGAQFEEENKKARELQQRMIEEQEKANKHLEELKSIIDKSSIKPTELVSRRIPSSTNNPNAGE